MTVNLTSLNNISFHCPFYYCKVLHYFVTFLEFTSFNESERVHKCLKRLVFILTGNSTCIRCKWMTNPSLRTLVYPLLLPPCFLRRINKEKEGKRIYVLNFDKLSQTKKEDQLCNSDTFIYQSKWIEGGKVVNILRFKAYILLLLTCK